MIENQIREKYKKLETISLIVMVIVGKIVSVLPFLALILFFVKKDFFLRTSHYSALFIVDYVGLLALFPIIISLRKSMKQFAEQQELEKAEQKSNFLMGSLILMVLLLLPFFWLFIDYLGFFFPVV